MSVINSANMISTASPEKERERDEIIQAEDLRYGWGKFRPECLQCFNKAGWVLFFLSVASFQQSFSVNGMVSTSFSAIERRFGLTSTQTGFIASSYEIAGIPFILLISYLGALGHRTRWVALGMFLLGAGSIVYCIPHFATGVYSISESDRPAQNLCPRNSSTSDSCPANTENTDLSNYFYVFLIAQALNGIGAAPLFTIGLTYLDDCCSKENAALYTCKYVCTESRK